MKDLIERLKRTEYDDLDACKAAEALELCYEMLDHLCVGAVEWHTEIDRLTAELEATKKAVQQNYFRVVEVTAERDALKGHLAYAIKEAEGWADDANGVVLVEPEMEAARAAIQGAGK